MAKAKGWRQRLRRGRLGWLGRIEGVEKPALLLGLGLVLYRVWRTRDGNHGGNVALDRPARGGWRSVLGHLRQKLTRGLASDFDRGGDGGGDADAAASTHFGSIPPAPTEHSPATPTAPPPPTAPA